MPNHRPVDRLGLTLLILLGAMVLYTVFALLVVKVAYGHEAPSGWHYDGICCGDKDCAPVIQSVVGPDGNLASVTTKFGTVSVPSKRDWMLNLTSKDGSMHACIYPEGQLRCLYHPPGS